MAVHHAEHATNTILGSAFVGSLLGMISQDTLISIGAICLTGGGLAIKLAMDLRKANTERDQAEAVSWGVKLGEMTAKATEWEEKFKAMKAQNEQQAAEMRAMQGKLATLVVSQNDVIKTVNKQQTRVKEAVKRVEAVEQAVGSSSNLDLPATTDGTNLDMPNMG